MKLAVIFWLTLLGAALAEPTVDRSELPRIAPTEQEDALGTFKIVPNYKLELVAAEPLVVDPIAMSFDEEKRMFVVEMRGYSERRDDKLGRIRMLVDDDGDGKFDRSTIYARGLAWPTAVVAWNGGAFVAATPDIYYFKDDDGDGVADTKKIVFTGFGKGASRLNVQALVNNLQMGPDGRIHGAAAGNGGRIDRVGETRSETTELRGVDFSFDPNKLDFRAENGGGQYGFSFDRQGRKFVCSNSNHIQQIMYDRRYNGSPLPFPRVDIAADGPAAEVFRLSPDEPWRVVRTRWRVAGQVGGPVEGGGRVSGYFTAATGICIHQGEAIICDAGSNLVHRKVFADSNAVQLLAQRPPHESDVEFLASTDNWFRPVQAISGPDGALYIADMYREVIEHPWSIPDSIKAHLDLNSGNDRGRIYRIVAAQEKMLPVEVSDPLIQRIAGTESLESLTDKWRAEFTRIAKHESSAVRFQLALTLGLRKGDWRLPILAELLRASEDRWVRAAALKALGRSAGVAFTELVNKDDAPVSDDALVELARHAIKTESAEGLKAIRLLGEPTNARMRILAAVAEADLGGQWVDSAIDDAKRISSDASALIDERLAAIELLFYREEGAQHLKQMFSLTSDQRILDRIAEASAKDDGEEWAALLVQHWDQLSSNGKAHAVHSMVHVEFRLPELFRAIKDGTIPSHLIDNSTAEGWMESERPEISKPAIEIFGARRGAREEVIEKYEASLILPGNAERGQAHYEARCAICHRAGKLGSAFGPDMSAFRTAGRESILTNLIDPNREVAPQFAAYAVVLDDGSTLVGRMISKDDRELQLGFPAGVQQTIDRKRVSHIKSFPQSLMPVGLEAGLSNQDVADLLEFLTSEIAAD